MSPVRTTRNRDVRSIAFAVGGLVLVVVLLGAFLWTVPRLSESGRVEVRLGLDTFDAGNAEFRAPSLAEDGPFLFSDVASGERDIFVQHIGDDPRAGWSAFDARRPGTSRSCTLRWDKAARWFVDPCDGTTISASGDGLPHYPVDINADTHVIVHLRPTNDRQPEPTPTRDPPPPTSVIPRTGGTLP